MLETDKVYSETKKVGGRDTEVVPYGTCYPLKGDHSTLCRLLYQTCCPSRLEPA